MYRSCDTHGGPYLLCTLHHLLRNVGFQSLLYQGSISS